MVDRRDLIIVGVVLVFGIALEVLGSHHPQAVTTIFYFILNHV